MAISKDRQKKISAIKTCIKAGLTNPEIMEELAPLWEISKEMIRAHRRSLGVAAPLSAAPYTYREGRVTKRLTGRCPKCRGLIVNGGVRMGMPANDIQNCANCGLTNESQSYYDVRVGERVEL